VEVLAEIIAAIFDVWNKNRFIYGPNWGFVCIHQTVSCELEKKFFDQKVLGYETFPK